MPFKPNLNKKVRLEELNKTALLKTVKQLQRRETTLLNRIAKVEREAQQKVAEASKGQADRLLQNLAPAVEFGYRAGEKGADNLEMTLFKWFNPTSCEVEIDSNGANPQTLDNVSRKTLLIASSAALKAWRDAEETTVMPRMLFPWELPE